MTIKHGFWLYEQICTQIVNKIVYDNIKSKVFNVDLVTSRHVNHIYFDANTTQHHIILGST
jgi:hypothetical protein